MPGLLPLNFGTPTGTRSTLRIAIVIERFTPASGGVENVAWQVAHGLLAAGEDVTVLTRSAEAQTPVRLLPVPVSRLWQPLRIWRFARESARATGGRSQPLTPRPFDIVHSFSRTPAQDLYRAGGGSHAAYLDAVHPGWGGRWRRLSPRHRVLLEIERRVFADPTQRIQCSSQQLADVLVHRHGVDRERLFVLPNAVDAARFAPEQHRREARALRSAETGSADPELGPIWLFPGSGWKRKGLDALLGALTDPRHATLQLWIAGRDDPRPWRSRVEALGLSSRVRFLGERRDLEVVYAAVDGMVLPTRYDAFANVTLEAAAAGLPIVTSDANGAREWLGEAVLSVRDPEDPSPLADALAQASNPQRARALGEAARARAAQLDWKQHVDALRSEYARIVADRESPMHRDSARAARAES